MLKKVLFICLFTIWAIAQTTQSQAIEAIKANPSLLNTPQAQAEMTKRGISKNQVLNKINSNNVSQSETNTEIINVIENETPENTTINNNIKQNNLVFNPLQYKTNTEKLKEIKSKQNIIQNQKLERFSKKFFTNKNTLNPSTIAVPEYYIINKNDMVSIWIYGGVNKNIETKVNNNGNINIETLGPIKIAGLSFKEVQAILSEKLSSAFGGAKVSVNISNYSTIQIMLTGSVKNAGVYNIPSLSTVKDLLITSNGIKDNGSIRNVQIKRDGEVIASMDFYDLLTGKNEKISTLLRNGDVVFVPKASKLVSIYGSVETPAIYELKENEKLDTLISYAGNLNSNASKSGIKVEGFNYQEKKIVSQINFNEIHTKILNDGDRVFVYDIDEVYKESVFIYGNVVRPGSRDLVSSLSDLLISEIKTVGLKGMFLNDTLFTYGMIKSHNDDLTSSVNRFNLANVIAGKEDVKLQAEDEIYIFNNLDTNLNPYVSIKGSVVSKTGEYQYFNGLTVSDLIQIAGVKSPYDLNAIKVTSYSTNNLMPEIKMIDAKESKTFKLNAYDEVELYDYYDLNHVSKVLIQGEINLPDTYSLNENMTLQDLINVAGGFTQKAYLKYCEIIRYKIVNDERLKEVFNIPLKKASQFELEKFDEVTIKQIPNWFERKTVEIRGEVKFPGNYTIESGEKLFDVIERAGGFTSNAFTYAAVFTRVSIAQLQQEKLNESLAKLKQNASVLNNSKSLGEKKDSNLNDTVQTIQKLEKDALKYTPIGRVSINLDHELSDSNSNIVLKDKDRLIIPSYNDTVLVMGEVMNSTAIIYKDDDIETYIELAGGLSELADDENIYVIHANGSAEKYSAGIFLSSGAEIKKGDVIVVPQKLIQETGIQYAKDISGILYQFAVTAASLKTVGAF